ncbi:class I SAM-dependent methyltransferase [Actinophytocola sediminis]
MQLHRRGEPVLAGQVDVDDRHVGLELEGGRQDPGAEGHLGDDVGAGTGANFAYYPATVTRVLAVEPEPRLRALAEQAARAAPVPVEVVDGLAQRLPVEDATADTVVCALVLCSVPDQAAALAEIRRILRPSGRFRFLEHVRADTAGMIRLQRFLDATLWPLVVGGCHTGRDTVAAVEQAGFTLDRLDRFQFPPVRTPASSHVLGMTTR